MWLGLPRLRSPKFQQATIFIRESPGPAADFRQPYGRIWKSVYFHFVKTLSNQDEQTVYLHHIKRTQY